jgi:hypothetical protein
MRHHATDFIEARSPGLIPAGNLAQALDGEDIVSETIDGAAGNQGSERKRSMGWFALVGFSRGLIPFVGFCWPLLLLGANAKSFPLATFAIVNPLVSAGVGCLCHCYPYATRWRTPSFFAIEPLPARERQERIRRLSRFVWASFGMGIVTALAATSLEVAFRGWTALDLLIPALLIYPWLGAYAGFIFGLRPGDPKPSIRRLRVSLRTSMILVAYIALLFGLGMQAVHISGAARERRALSLNAQSMGDMFGSQSEKSLAEMHRRMKNAEELRHGRIPDELQEVNRAFLKSLDKTASDEYKKRRYSLMADSEEQQAKVAEEMFRTNERAANYQKTRADKYRKAAQEPWAPVGPDPSFEQADPQSKTAAPGQSYEPPKVLSSGVSSQ